MTENISLTLLLLAKIQVCLLCYSCSADMCYYIDEETGDEDNAKEVAACKMTTKQIYAVGGLRGYHGHHQPIENHFSTPPVCSTKPRPGQDFDDSHHDAGARIIAAVISACPMQLMHSRT